MTTLTDRYVHVALRSVPESQRDELGREIRAAVADAAEPRLDAGAEPQQAEREALLELGDPARLAAQYLDRPLQLIGPTVYLEWKRLTITLLAIILPILALVAAGAGLLDHDPLGEIIGSTVALPLTAGVHVVFWTTLAVVIAERTGKAASLHARWSPDDLPEIDPRSGVRLVDAVASIVVAGLGIAALAWQQHSSLIRDAAGEAVPLLEPANWSSWWPLLIALAAIEAVVAVTVWRVGRLTPVLLVARILIGSVWVVTAVWLFATERVFNPAFLERLEWWSPSVQESVRVSGVLAVIAFTLWGFIDLVLRARRPGGSDSRGGTR